MASFIDTAVPEQGSPTTSSVRDNFAAAKNEIEALQSDLATKADAANPIITGTAQIQAANIPTLTSSSLNVTSSFRINGVLVTADAGDLNTLSGLTVSASELNYLNGVTSNVQNQLTNLQNNKLDGNETIILSGDASGSGTTFINVTVDMADLSGTTYAAGNGDRITGIRPENINGRIASSQLPEGSLPVDITGDAGSVDGYDIVVTSSPGTDPNTIYFVI